MQNRTKIQKNTFWKPVYGVLRWLVPTLILLILYKKYVRNNAITLDAFMMHLGELPWYWFAILPLFAMLNWLAEVMKWRFLVNKTERHTFRSAVKGVLSGVAVSQLLPYRTGEYLGRLAFVSSKNRLKAGVLSVAGSFSQLVVTLVPGIAAFLVLRPVNIPFPFFVSLSGLVLMLATAYFFIPRFRQMRGWKWLESVAGAFALLKGRDMLRLLAYSVFRYLCFLLPYAMLVMHYRLGGIHSVMHAATAVSCIYFLQTVAPSFIITDLMVRVGISAIVFSGSVETINGYDHLPGMIIYLFNVVLPMCAGALVLFFIRIRK